MSERERFWSGSEKSGSNEAYLYKGSDNIRIQEF